MALLRFESLQLVLIRPHAFEVVGKRLNESGVVGDHNVLRVALSGTSGPVERSVDDQALVDDGKLKM